MEYLFDTNVLVHYVRDSPLWRQLQVQFGFTDEASFVVSEVTIGELMAFALKSNWGQAKTARMNRAIEKSVIVPISDEGVKEAYAQIQAFSRGKHPLHRLKGSSRTMQHNDIWIAATAHVYGLTLLTADRDFDHLEGLFLNAAFIDANAYR